MKKLLVISLLLLSINAGAQTDSTRFERLDSLLTEYFSMMNGIDVESKCLECDYLIDSCADSLTRTHVALKIYDHYKEPLLMGDEAVAIHVFDKWFADGSVKMRSETEKMDAAIHADFNRNTLIGMQAPEVVLKKVCGGRKCIPAKGRTGILFFYDTGCSKCRAEVKWLPKVLEDISFEMDFYAVYTGSDKKAWREFRNSHFRFKNRNVEVFNLWDPGMDSNYQMLYGVLVTPRIFVVDTDGLVIGRRLEPYSLKQLLQYIGIAQTHKADEGNNR